MYEVALTVKDVSGNVGTLSAVINSVDPTIPRFDASLLPNFPTTATEGEAISFEVVVFDDYDAEATLQALGPSAWKDTDGNGVLKDDLDRAGLNPPSRLPARDCRKSSSRSSTIQTILPITLFPLTSPLHQPRPVRHRLPS